MVDCSLCGDRFHPLVDKEGLIVVIQPYEIDSLDIFAGRINLCARCANVTAQTIRQWQGSLEGD